MRTIIVAIMALAPAAAMANPERGHDRRLERAAAEIVAGRIGDIRGGFRHNERPEFVAGNSQDQVGRVLSPQSPSSRDAVWKDGLAPAHGIPEYRRGKI